MLFSQLRLFTLSLALSLLWPAAAFAQSTADLPKLSRPQVQIKVDFVVASAADIDSLGINFDLVPLTPSSAAMPANQRPVFLQFAAGSRAVQLYQTLTRTRGPAIASQTITTVDNTAAAVRVNVDLPSDAPPVEMPNPFARFPKVKTITQAQGELTLIPHIHPDNSVTLALVPDAGSAKAAPGNPILLRTVPSGQMLVLGQGGPILGGLFRNRNKISDTQELLIFITPTIVGVDVPKEQAGQSDQGISPVPETAFTLNKTISVDVSHGDLSAVVGMLERQVGLKAIVNGTDQMFQPVYVHLDAAPVSKALAVIARSAGAQITLSKSGEYVFSALPEAARTPLPIPAAPTLGGSSVLVTP